MKIVGFVVESVRGLFVRPGRGARVQPGAGYYRIDIKQYSKIGFEAPGGDSIQLFDKGQIEPAPVSLERQCRIHVSIAQNKSSGSQARPNDLPYVLRAVGRIEYGFCFGADFAALIRKQQRPNLYAYRSSAWFASYDGVCPTIGKVKRGFPQMRALAGAINPFKSDKPSAH